jgi:hypothetical protein
MSAFFTRRGKAAERVNYVGYIESSGSQYIDAEFQPNQNTRVVMDVQNVNASNQSNRWFFGCRGGSSRKFDICLYGSTTTYYDAYASKNVTYTVTDVRHLIDKNKNVTLLDGVVVATFDASTFATGQNLYLLALNNAGTLTNQVSARLYSCQIYDNDVLVRDMWPCYDPDGVACLYDKVEGKYYYNAGTGEFGVGESASGESKQITFTVDGTAYTAEEGMTWAQWVNSSYNTAGFTNNGIEILHPIQGSVADETTTSWYVKTTDEIVAGRAYLVTA